MNKVIPSISKKFHYKKYIVILIFILIISAFLLYSRYISTKGLIIKEYKITNNNLPSNFHGFKIVHLSDIHYGRIIKKEQLDSIVKQINLLKPDIVVITGDLLDDTTDINNEELIQILKKIQANVGKYAIKGNHDMAHRDWKSIIEESNFYDLDDAYELIYNNGYEPIMIAGMSTNLSGVKDINKKIENITNYLNSFKGNDASKTKEEIEALKLSEPKYKILIMHEPDFIDTIDYNEYNLILAGHSHNGQV